MSSAHHTFALQDEAATLALGAALAKILRPGMVIHLIGDLGAGKTTLVRGLLRSLGHAGPVKSPTYALVELYVISGYIVYHFDFYRFNQPEEWLEAGLDEHFNPGTICLVEWPEKAGDLLPPADLEIRLDVVVTDQDGDARKLTLHALTETGQLCLSGLQFPPCAKATSPP